MSRCTDLELVLVDDGSPDRCGAICDEYALKDSRIKVIHKENGGLSDARNAGLDWVMAHSDAEYIAFVDSDDQIHPQMYEKLLEVIEREGSDMVSCSLVNVSADEAVEYPQYTEPTSVTTVESKIALARFYEQYFEFIRVSACVKVYRRSVFITLRFRKGIIFEDQDLFPYIIAAAKRITVLPYPFYYYTISPNSITRCGFNEKYIDTMEIHGRHIEFFVQRGLLSQANGAGRLYIQSLILTYLEIHNNHPQFKPVFWKLIKEKYIPRQAVIRKNCGLSRMQQLILDIFPYFPFLAVMIYRHINK